VAALARPDISESPSRRKPIVVLHSADMITPAVSTFGISMSLVQLLQHFEECHVVVDPYCQPAACLTCPHDYSLPPANPKLDSYLLHPAQIPPPQLQHRQLAPATTSTVPPVPTTTASGISVADRNRRWVRVIALSSGFRPLTTLLVM
jgi:hypothetical protein